MNPNYSESTDGYTKNEQSIQKGNADYFARPIPPVRNAAGRPLAPDSDGKIDIALWIKEINNGQ